MMCNFKPKRFPALQAHKQIGTPCAADLQPAVEVHALQCYSVDCAHMASVQAGTINVHVVMNDFFVPFPASPLVCLRFTAVGFTEPADRAMFFCQFKTPIDGQAGKEMSVAEYYDKMLGEPLRYPELPGETGYAQCVLRRCRILWDFTSHRHHACVWCYLMNRYIAAPTCQ